jgi:hypothetical protein
VLVEELGNCPPESGGQHDRDVVEIVRGVVPEPHIFRLGNHPSRHRKERDDAALLTQEGNSFASNATFSFSRAIHGNLIASTDNGANV